MSAPKGTIPLFGLALDGVYRAASVARDAVRSYRTFSPLPALLLRRSDLCGTFRRLAPPRRYLASRPVEPGLSSTPPETDGTATARPTPRGILRDQSVEGLISIALL